MERKTTQTQEMETSNDMEFPQLMICTQIGYKTDVLTEMNLSTSVLSTMEPHLPLERNHDFDSQSVWDSGTYSSKDFAIYWMVWKGDVKL